MNLNPQQQQALESGQAIETASGGVACVVLRKDVYDRVARIMQDDEDSEMMASLAASSEANGWNEPEMDDYDRYDEIKNEQK